MVFPGVMGSGAQGMWGAKDGCPEEWGGHGNWGLEVGKSQGMGVWGMWVHMLGAFQGLGSCGNVVARDFGSWDVGPRVGGARDKKGTLGSRGSEGRRGQGVGSREW